MIISERTLKLMAIEGCLLSREVLHDGEKLKRHISKETTITYWQTVNPSTMQVGITARTQT